MAQDGRVLAAAGREPRAGATETAAVKLRWVDASRQRNRHDTRMLPIATTASASDMPIRCSFQFWRSVAFRTKLIVWTPAAKRALSGQRPLGMHPNNDG